MTYSVKVLRPARKVLEKLARAQPKHAEAIEDAIEDLAEEPRPRCGKPLTGVPGVWRIRVGGYRVCYTINDGELLVLVVTISTRDDVYQMLRRYLGQ
ncbi:type II toxin-antitoxin system RelE/ParE family toxin [Amycolatopsis acidicola]|uniref:Type II toxin-antitoxin system RelE/ParE family toxin n=1 Tax=Amycolatopsis acidicola TaxID=2596893 RepID=A0A5N0UPY3_9PSEU|nr:type II toxin-antitoxin system RelE/ParE family toxin [Amycolatopsis acidicola]KAA9151896.1 type II toxin-antitoxin system RelE/ParE family toxin [Amycolatopsis acidicola]